MLNEIKNSDGEVVTFIDELHTMVGAGGGSEGAMDAGNMLKPMLARGELRMVVPPRWTNTAKTLRKTRL